MTAKTIYDEQTDSEGIRAFDAGIQLLKTQEAIMQWLEKVIKENQIAFAIENLHGDFVGTAKIHSINEQAGTFSFAIRIFRSYRCNGYAKDALEFFCDMGFMSWGVKKRTL